MSFLVVIFNNLFLNFFTFFFFNDTATTEIYTLSLHDALPIYPHSGVSCGRMGLCPLCPARSRWSRSTLKHGTGFPRLSPGDDPRDGSARQGTRRLVPSSQALSLYAGSDPYLDSGWQEGEATERPPPSYLIHPHWVVGQHRITGR